MSARLAAVAAAIVWGLFYFGLIDLLVVIIQDVRFDPFYLLETGWGLLYTVLVAVPLVVFAVRPRWPVLLQQLVVVAAAVLVCALITPAAAQIAPAVLLAMTALVLSVWSGHGLAPIRGLSLHGVNRGMAALALVAAVSAVGYAAQMIQAARSGEPDDDTWGLMHLPMQAAFGLSVAGVAAVAVLARAGNSAGWQVPAMTAAASAAWLGLVSMAYPGHLGSLGRVGGAAAVAWGVAFAVGVVGHPQKARWPELPRHAESGEPSER
jgi:hypothetical protein